MRNISVFGMIFHRVGTIGHIVASTHLTNKVLALSTHHQHFISEKLYFRT